MDTALLKGSKMRRAYLIFVLVLIFVPILSDFSIAQRENPPGGRIVVCMIQLEHADAEYLASVLKPFLSPEGSLAPYKPTNTLIIRDREPVVNMLSEIIKGKTCTPSSQSSSN
jgi:type II secretory pathway component GspD/PulD (secretin)